MGERWPRRSVLLAPILLGLQALAPPRRRGPRPGGTLRLVLNEDPGGFDVHRDTTHTLYNRARELFSTLVRYAPDAHRLEPELLARLPEVSADGRVYRFELRPGVRFHDGVELTAQDVRFTFLRILDPSTLSPHSGFLAPVEGAAEVMEGRTQELAGFQEEGRYRFRVTLAAPYTPFVHVLALPAFSIYPRHAVEAAGPRWPFTPIGSGPFRLDSYQRDRLIRLVRHTGYFETGLPYLDAVEYRVLPDALTAALEFEKGSLDVMRLAEPELARPGALGGGGSRLVVGPSFNTYYLLFNVRQPPFTDARVRRAVAHAVDVGEMVNHLLRGRAERAFGIIPPGILAAQRLPLPPPDPQQARRLLRESGFPTGLVVEALVPSGGTLFRWYEAVQAMLWEVGLRLRLRPVDRATFLAARAQGRLAVHLGNWWAEFADPDNFLYPLFHSTQSARYSGGYARPEVDRLLERARRAADPDERIRLYREAERIIVAEDVAALPLWHLHQYAMVQPWVHGYAHHPTGLAASSHRFVWLSGR